jgi:hypothetical protein
MAVWKAVQAAGDHAFLVDRLVPFGLLLGVDDTKL